MKNDQTGLRILVDSGTLVTIPSVHVIRAQKENTREFELAGVPGKKLQLRGLPTRTATNTSAVYASAKRRSTDRQGRHTLKTRKGLS